jgi:hypothetical protein
MAIATGRGSPPLLCLLMHQVRVPSLHQPCGYFRIVEHQHTMYGRIGYAVEMREDDSGGDVRSGIPWIMPHDGEAGEIRSPHRERSALQHPSLEAGLREPVGDGRPGNTQGFT